MQIDNRAIIMDKLNSLGVKTVTVEYCGSGDSGAVESVEFEPRVPKKTSIEISKEKDTFVNGSWVRSVEQVTVSLREAIEDFVYKSLETHHAGWENDSGAEGSLTINIDTGTITLNHTQFFTQSEDFEYSL